MISDTQIRIKGMQALAGTLGDIQAERFITLMIREPLDYTEWRRDLWQGKSVEEISNEAMRYRRTHRLRKIGSARKTATKRNK